MTVAFFLPHRNPHLEGIVERAAQIGRFTLVSCYLGKVPHHRVNNEWREGGTTSVWASLAWLWSANALIFLGAGRPAPAMPFLFLAACISGKPIFLVSEGFRARPALFLRGLLYFASALGNGRLFAIGNTCDIDFRDAGLTWRSVRFGYAEACPRGTADPTTPARSRQDKICLLAVGQLIPRKRIDWLIERLARHPMAGRLELRVCGAGPEGESLRKLASRSPIDVQFLGFVRGVALAAEYENADVFVHPAKYEGWGVVLNHALSFGLPIVAYCGVRSAEGLLIESGVNGFVFEDESDFDDAITALTDDIQLRERFSDASRRRAVNWTVDALAEILSGEISRSLGLD